MSHILWDFVKVEIEYDLNQYVHVCKSYLAFIMFIAYRLMGGSSQTAQLQKLKGTSMIVFIVELADLIYNYYQNLWVKQRKFRSGCTCVRSDYWISSTCTSVQSIYFLLCV